MQPSAGPAPCWLLSHAGARIDGRPGVRASRLKRLRAPGTVVARLLLRRARRAETVAGRVATDECRRPPREKHRRRHHYHAIGEAGRRRDGRSAGPVSDVRRRR